MCVVTDKEKFFLAAEHKTDKTPELLSWVFFLVLHYAVCSAEKHMGIIENIICVRSC